MRWQREEQLGLKKGVGGVSAHGLERGLGREGRNASSHFGHGRLGWLRRCYANMPSQGLNFPCLHRAPFMAFL